MKNKNDNRGVIDMLETGFGKYYEELIELEFNCSLDEFIEWFVECDENGCYYTNI